jgi:hypothetical protein
MQESGGHLSVVPAFKQAKEASLLVMVLIVCVVNDSGDAADNVPLLSCQEELHCGMLKKGILPGIEKGFALDKEGRDPVRIISIDLPGKLQKGADLTRLQGDNVDGGGV